MRILILGASGMLGHKMHETLARTHEVVSTTRGTLDELPTVAEQFFARGGLREGFDATTSGGLEALLGELEPEAVVNCIGVIKQRDAAHDALESIAINSLFPHQLASVCSPRGVRVVHFSTDCVFSGDKGSYTEDDLSDARDLYGRTKYLGELEGEGVLTVRSSIIGRELANFESLVEWFLAQRGSIRGFSRAIYSGLTTLEMAKLVQRLLEEHPGLSGVWHIASGAVSKHELLLMMRDCFGHDVEIAVDDTFVCDRSLDGRRFLAATGIEVSSWEEMVVAMAEDGVHYERKDA